MGTLKPRRQRAEMRRRTGLLAIALAGALLGGGAPARAAEEPVATATIPPPPPAATPMVVPLPQRAAPVPPKQVAPKTARRTERERKPAATADRRKPAMRNAAEASRLAEREKARASASARQQTAAAKREQPRARAEYRPRRYYYREYRVEPPYPPPWYDRGPPFAAMPYPRGMMPPW
jgi:hypothetical protein